MQTYTAEARNAKHMHDQKDAYLCLVRDEAPALVPPAAAPLPGRLGGRTTGPRGPLVRAAGNTSGHVT